ncbi:MAG: hypothetical protein M5T61_20530 [Acidimicrobiia bacterium]|nr:hypothetical protein [Acidimicrobiia bacterium]
MPIATTVKGVRADLLHLDVEVDGSYMARLERDRHLRAVQEGEPVGVTAPWRVTVCGMSR